MVTSVIVNQINKRLNTLNLESGSIVVLKGIPLSVVDPSAGKINIAQVVSDKLGYFMSVCRNRKYLTYEEFLLIANFVVDQYKVVYVLNNNMYMSQYPVEECFEVDVRAGLLTHFAESEQDETDESYIGDIDEFIGIFQGLKEYNGYLLGVYSENQVIQNSKIVNVNLFDRMNDMMPRSTDRVDSFVELIEEADYIDFIKLVFSEPDEIHIKVSNYTGDINKLKEHIALVAYYWRDYTDIYFLETRQLTNEYKNRDDYTGILRKYWGYDSFRSLKVYDITELEQGKKEVISVSQEAIIANLVEEVEHCEEGSDFRDVFVTAPTGAGKSVMFQVPAIYLAEKYGLLTIVISPLIGLMNDQVKNLELKNYSAAKTINSDISPIIRQDIINKVSVGNYNILYISPETLLSRSAVEQLIGDRTIGMIVIDEAHIVTTWGKQFRPDYWYLGDHIRKLRKKQMESKNMPFVIATFTATAIYHGIEDMYTETINSLHMLSPVTYLGYVKREDINIVIKRAQKKKDVRSEYELDKFDKIESLLRRAIITDKKVLIYFPTVALIDRCYEYLRNKRESKWVAVYHGSLSKDKKQENYEKFLAKEKILMLATKAFGMGIDINDIEIVAHFAPTGNVCDYVQEIGRAARRSDLQGEALYDYNPRDFKHLNRLHGLSQIQKYQLIQVIGKIIELYQHNMNSGMRSNFTKRRNSMLLDAENFLYIFGSPVSEDVNNVNKVKTALLLIQKDFESKIGFSPITVRPVPLFSIGYFAIDVNVQMRLNKRYPDAVTEIESTKHICRVLLSKIWTKDYRMQSFPKFKYLIYTNDSENLDLISKYPMTPALSISIAFDSEYSSLFKNIWTALKNIIGKKVITSEHTAISEIVELLVKTCGINKYKAQTICEVVIASMDVYRKNFARTTSPIALEKVTTDGTTKYQFNVAVNSYFTWVESGLRKIEKETHDNKLYLIDNQKKHTREFNVILGVLESIGVLTFEMVGGADSQLYIYINQVQTLRNILNAPFNYHNRMLEAVAERHMISVKMLTYLYEGNFSSSEIWSLLEDYFLGVIPEKVKQDCRIEKPDIVFD